MKTGNMNERNVFLSVWSQDWCSALYEAGLFASKEFPCVAASPDGVAHSMNAITWKLCMQLLSAARTYVVAEDFEQQLSEIEVRTIQEAIKAYTQKKRKIEDVETSFNAKPAWKRLHRSQNHVHKLAKIENQGNPGQVVKKQKQGICAACVRHTCFYCTTCLIPLHAAIVNSNSKERKETAGYFTSWHRNDYVKLTAAAKEDLKRKREMSKQRTKR